MRDPYEDALQDFRGDNPSEEELRTWRSALERRLDAMKEEAAESPEAAERLKAKIEQTRKQVAVLAQEEAISGFVEGTVRAAVADAGPVSPESAPHDTSLPPWASLDFDDEPE